MRAEELLIDGPVDASQTLVLAHGAGQGMRSPFMQAIAAGIGAAGVRVVRFEFPYMVNANRTGRKRPPDREPVLQRTWRGVIAELRAIGEDRLVIGGKSMGGRIASQIADESGVCGLVCLGYPFHPPGKPERQRLESREVPANVRDPLTKC